MADTPPPQSHIDPMPPGISLSLSQEFTDLLHGLGSDDLNDFELEEDSVSRGHPQSDGSEDAPTPPHDIPQSLPHTSSPPPLECHANLLAFETASSFAATPPVAIGFLTGGGKALPPPSAAALAKARRLVDADGQDDMPTTPLPLSKRPKVDSAQPRTLAAGDMTPSSSEPVVTQSTQQFAPTPDKFAPSSGASVVPDIPSGFGFTTGNGRGIAPPSKEAIAAAQSLFNRIESDALSEPRDVPARPAFTAPLLRPNSAQAPVPTLPPSSTAATSARARALALFGESANPTTPSTPVPSKRSLIPPQSFQFRTPTMARTPLRQTTNTFPLPGAIPDRRPVEIKATPITKRLGLGGTPSSAKRTKKGFVTPFKDPKKAKLETSPRETPTRKPAPSVAQDVEVFDLKKPLERKSYRNAFLKPSFYSPSELEEMGLPEEIWTLDLDNAIYYRFIAEDGSLLNHQAALTVLATEGCRLATSEWVDNHWRMILWKLSGVVRSKPQFYDERWNWREVIEQLKYRYEREFGAAQRPIIRRIQERDSAASIPMILCVSAVHHPPPIQVDGKSVPSKPYLELTDGWYPIKAEVDDCLARSINRNVIAVGRKLAISGAKLNSSSDGDDVLKAFEKSRLVLSGNSSSLARWDARLGAQHPFIAGLSSLSMDGGVITLMDIIVEKVFPIAFIFADKSKNEDPWDEAEEAIRADRHEENYESELARLNEEMRSKLSGVCDLAQMLATDAEEVEVSSTDLESPPDSLEKTFDMLLASPDQHQILRGKSDAELVHLATYARERMNTELQEGKNEIQTSLESLLPPRQVRDFRMVRIVDAWQGRRKEAFRAGMLTVWDARGMEFTEGKRYRVSNLVPARSGDWGLVKGGGGARKEIYLHSRRDTRWQPV